MGYWKYPGKRYVKYMVVTTKLYTLNQCIIKKMLMGSVSLEGEVEDGGKQWGSETLILVALFIGYINGRRI